MNQLQKSLRLNALFSSISGILLIIFNVQIAAIFSTNNKSVFWIIGLILVFFAGTIAYEIFKQRPIAVRWIILQDFMWVIGSIILIMINPFEISKLGNIIIVIIAVIVLYMGVNQAKALAQFVNKKVSKPSEKN